METLTKDEMIKATVGDNICFKSGFYVGSDVDILNVDDWNNFEEWIEGVIHELETEERRREIWNDIKQRYSEREYEDAWSEYMDSGSAEEEFRAVMENMGYDNSTLFYDEFVLVDNEGNETVYTASKLRRYAKQHGITI